MNSYKKLKKEIAQLQKDVEELALRPDSVESMLIRFIVVMKTDLYNAIWFGSTKKK
jgi:hypothetical protein